MNIKHKLIIFICVLLLVDLLLDPVFARGRKRKGKGNKRKGKGRGRGRGRGRKATTLAPTTTTPQMTPNPRSRSVSGLLTNFFGDILPQSGSIDIPGFDTTFTWGDDSDDDDDGFMWTTVPVEPQLPSGELLIPTNPSPVDPELFQLEWRGKGSFTGDVRLHCLEKGCSKGVVQIYNREERTWGNVCSGGWGREETQLVCRYLQFTGRGRTRRLKVGKAPKDVKKVGNAWDNVSCNNRVEFFAECMGSAMEKDQRCDSGYYAKVQCKGGRVVANEEVECDLTTSVRCANGQKCIRKSYVCDGMSDCPWGTDEENCTTGVTTTVCGENHFDCGHSHGGCITNSYRCDGEEDCTNGADEVDCKDYMSSFKRYRATKLRATNYESGWRHVTPYVCARKCQEEKTFGCASFNYNRATKECDLTSSTRHSLGVSPALAAHQDFDYYELRNLECDEFKCGNGACLPRTLVCNGENDCQSGEDEADCEEHNLYPEIIFGRLSGDPHPILSKIEGHLQVSVDENFASNFGLVCDIGWGIEEANVACRQLGFKKGAARALHGQTFRRTLLPYKLSNVKCRGHERSLAECQHNGWNNATCPIDHEAGVICLTDDYTTRPITTTTRRPSTTTRASTTPRTTLLETLPPVTTPSNVQCGKKPVTASSRIVGGTAVQPNAWPWQVGLWMYNQFKCGGTLLSQCWVLTAAHCIDQTMSLRAYHLMLGDHQTKYVDGTEQKFRVKQIIVHPNYNKDTSDKDIALIQLQEYNGKCATLNQQVVPACLPTSPTQFRGGHNCWITGWGQTSSNAVLPYQNELREARVPLIDNYVCTSRSKYGSTLTNDMQCAGFLRGGTDTCQGDSGGPLVCSKGDAYTIWGVTSFGNGCALPYYPGVYTKVANFVDWINQYIRN